MIQTKNKYCKETFIRLNYWYDRNTRACPGRHRESEHNGGTHRKNHVPTDIPIQVTACSLFPDTVNVPGRSS